ncbi:MAG: divalent-cation tolerance protein CutA [Pseudomonadota bacterium]
MAASDKVDEIQPVLVYITCPDQETARRLAHKSVTARLAACANILTGMQSVYAWNGDIHEDSEVVLLLKTRRALADRLIAEITDAHPYDTPAALIIPTDGGSLPFIDWIGSATTS